MKYKAGDKVRIRQLKAMERVCRKENDSLDDLLYFKDKYVPFNITRMDKYCGKIATIIKADRNIYDLDIDSGEHRWQDWMFEGYAFEFGEEIEVSNDGLCWCERIYVGYIDGAGLPYICVVDGCEKDFKNGNRYVVLSWRYARPIQKKHTIIIDGKEIEISEESYQKLKESLEG